MSNKKACGLCKHLIKDNWCKAYKSQITCVDEDAISYVSKPCTRFENRTDTPEPKTHCKDCIHSLNERCTITGCVEQGEFEAKSCANCKYDNPDCAMIVGTCGNHNKWEAKDEKPKTHCKDCIHSRNETCTKAGCVEQGEFEARECANCNHYTERTHTCNTPDAKEGFCIDHSEWEAKEPLYNCKGCEKLSDAVCMDSTCMGSANYQATGLDEKLCKTCKYGEFTDEEIMKKYGFKHDWLECKKNGYNKWQAIESRTCKECENYTSGTVGSCKTGLIPHIYGITWREYVLKRDKKDCSNFNPKEKPTEENTCGECKHLIGTNGDPKSIAFYYCKPQRNHFTNQYVHPYCNYFKPRERTVEKHRCIDCENRINDNQIWPKIKCNKNTPQKPFTEWDCQYFELKKDFCKDCGYKPNDGSNCKCSKGEFTKEKVVEVNQELEIIDHQQLLQVKIMEEQLKQVKLQSEMFKELNKKQKEEMKMEKNEKCLKCSNFNGQGETCKDGEHTAYNLSGCIFFKNKIKEATPMETDVKKEIEQKQLKIKKIKEEIVKEKEERKSLFERLDFNGKTHHPYLHRMYYYSKGRGKPYVWNKKYLKFLKNEYISIKRVKSLVLRESSSRVELFNIEDLLKLNKQKWRKLEETISNVIACQDDYCLMNLEDELCRLNKCKDKLLAIEEVVKEEVCNCKKHTRKKSKFCPQCGKKQCSNCGEFVDPKLIECDVCGGAV